MKLSDWTYRISSFFRYYTKARSIHSVDSPCLFELLRNALDEKQWYYAFDELEVLRRKMKMSVHRLKRTDWGKGGREYETTIGQVAKHSLSSARECRIYFRLAIECEPECVLELGTSLGLTTLYLSRSAPQAQIHTVEGDPILNDLARRHFRWMEGDNIRQHPGRFEEVLPVLIEEVPPFDYTFTDGHHTGDATIANVTSLLNHSNKKSMHLVHDIYHSKEMEQAWNELKQHELTDASVDLYHFGILIKNPDLIDPVHLSLIPGKWKPWSIGLFR